MNFFYFFKAGGFIMYPLLLCSILVWTIAIERWRLYRVFRSQASFLYQRISVLVNEKKIHEAKGVCSSVMDLVSLPYSCLLECFDQDPSACQSRLSRKLMETSQGLKKFLWILATIAAIAPFLGLLGTVTGIMRSFETIGESGKSGFAAIAPGLAEALITTAGGIIIAIMALIFYNYLQASLSRMIMSFKNQLEEVSELNQEWRIGTKN